MDTISDSLKNIGAKNGSKAVYHRPLYNARPNEHGTEERVNNMNIENQE